jgi:hypothetical protein
LVCPADGLELDADTVGVGVGVTVGVGLELGVGELTGEADTDGDAAGVGLELDDGDGEFVAGLVGSVVVALPPKTPKYLLPSWPPWRVDHGAHPPAATTPGAVSARVHIATTSFVCGL